MILSSVLEVVELLERVVQRNSCIFGLVNISFEYRSHAVSAVCRSVAALQKNARNTIGLAARAMW